MSTSRATAWIPLPPIAVMLGLVLAGTVAGIGTPPEAPPTRGVWIVEHPAHAMEQWTEAGVHRRLLLVADRELYAGTPSRESEGARFVDRALDEGLVRRIHHYVPTGDWPGLDRLLSEGEGFEPSPGGYRTSYIGVPVVIAPVSALAAPREPALLVIRPDRFSREEMERLFELLVETRFADLVTLVGPVSDDAVARLEDAYEVHYR